jgi:hypothetical protein
MNMSTKVTTDGQRERHNTNDDPGGKISCELGAGIRL